MTPNTGAAVSLPTWYRHIITEKQKAAEEYWNENKERLKAVLEVSTLITFFSGKVSRPRAVLHLLAGFAFFVLVVKISSLSSGSTAAIYDEGVRKWRWTTEVEVGDAQALLSQDIGALETEAESGRRGGLRIVVFGEEDIASPSPSPGYRERTTRRPGWTDVLCDELNCSDLLSFVPIAFDHQTKQPIHSLTSNALYFGAVNSVLPRPWENENGTAKEEEDSEYSFQPNLYPVPWDLPDLTRQVDFFLSMPPALTEETLFVFSFGTWDIWSLASLPIHVAKPAVAGMVGSIFEQAERIYRNTSSPISPSAAETGVGTGKRRRERTQNEKFRIIIPKLFDPTLTPGWKTQRPAIFNSKVMSETDQQRNAATLTKFWNKQLAIQGQEWALKPPDFLKDEDLRNTNATKDSSISSSTSGVRGERDAFVFDLPGYLLDIMINRQMWETGLTDAYQLGLGPAGGMFWDVERPCMTPVVETAGDESKKASGKKAEKEEEEGHMCEDPEEYLFYSGTTVSPRAITGLGRQAAEMVRNERTVRADWERLYWSG
ncbi:hypothetical protein QBC35DRAFT_442217 [Podospora australis]|uniref:Uncharacterized protein n=1 Tax=Podospora australis TaxID=1536484 RepID=A0AAN7AFJ7_9PEZI|nr:hypothetical protein QBC35DRAFT_442217 [Podospora australis]